MILEMTIALFISSWVFLTWNFVLMKRYIIYHITYLPYFWRFLSKVSNCCKVLKLILIYARGVCTPQRNLIDCWICRYVFINFWWRKKIVSVSKYDLNWLEGRKKLHQFMCWNFESDSICQNSTHTERQRSKLLIFWPLLKEIWNSTENCCLMLMLLLYAYLP